MKSLIDGKIVIASHNIGKIKRNSKETERKPKATKRTQQEINGKQKETRQ